MFSDRLVFVKAMIENHSLSEVDAAVYDEMWRFHVEQPYVVPDGFVYLQAS